MAMEPSVEALSATMTSASSSCTECRSPGRNLLRKPSVFQFNMTIAVFMPNEIINWQIYAKRLNNLHESEEWTVADFKIHIDKSQH